MPPVEGFFSAAADFGGMVSEGWSFKETEESRMDLR